MIIKRIGGKSKLSKWIISHIPECGIFVDVFGGSGAVIDEYANRNESFCAVLSREIRYVYNDLDGKVVNFFSVLRNFPHELAHKTALTPYSRTVFNESCEQFNDSSFNDLHPVDQALIFLIVNRQSFGSKMDNTWSVTRNGELNYETWNSMPYQILRAAKRFKRVFLENLDGRELIKKWDSKKTCFYLDPPYYGVEKDYYEVNKDEGFSHKNMFDVLKDIQGNFVVSYYDASGGNPFIEKYVELGCKIEKIKIKKDLPTCEIKPTVTEILIIKDR